MDAARHHVKGRLHEHRTEAPRERRYHLVAHAPPNFLVEKMVVVHDEALDLGLGAGLGFVLGFADWGSYWGSRSSSALAAKKHTEHP